MEGGSGPFIFNAQGTVRIGTGNALALWQLNYSKAIQRWPFDTHCAVQREGTTPDTHQLMSRQFPSPLQSHPLICLISLNFVLSFILPGSHMFLQPPSQWQWQACTRGVMEHGFPFCFFPRLVFLQKQQQSTWVSNNQKSAFFPYSKAVADGKYAFFLKEHNTLFAQKDHT